MAESHIDVALICDPGSVFYYSGYYGYLYMEFGRPTFLLIPRSGACSIITPTLEVEMAQRTSWVDDVIPWLDGKNGEWRTPLAKKIEPFRSGTVGIERLEIPQIVLNTIEDEVKPSKLGDLSQAISEMRMIKSPEEIQVARHTGEVAVAMAEGAVEATEQGLPEYELALAMTAAGTRKAAEIIREHYDDPLLSPTLHFHQILASGSRVAMCHHRSTVKPIEYGDALFICFCGIAEFHQFKLGFDRTFFVGRAKEQDLELYEIAVRSQRAALSAIRPGVTAEEVAAEYVEVIRAAGFEFPFRAGRSLGYSFNERPQLALGDKTVLQPGMVLAVDGAVNRPRVSRAQVGDSVLITDDGVEILTPFSKELEDILLT
jgi:Xaa-Pro aminopeptidase